MAGRIEGARWTTAVLIAASVLLGGTGITVSLLEPRAEAPPITNVAPDPAVPPGSAAPPPTPRQIDFMCAPDACLGLDLETLASASVPGPGRRVGAQAIIYPGGEAAVSMRWPADTASGENAFNQSRAEAALDRRLEELLGLGADPAFIGSASPEALAAPEDWGDVAFVDRPWFEADEDMPVQARAPIGDAAGDTPGEVAPPPVAGSAAPPTRIFGLTVSEFIGVLVIVLALIAAGACGLWALLTRDPDRRAMLNRYTTGCVTFIGGAVSQTFGS